MGSISNTVTLMKIKTCTHIHMYTHRDVDTQTHTYTQIHIHTFFFLFLRHLKNFVYKLELRPDVVECAFTSTGEQRQTNFVSFRKVRITQRKLLRKKRGVGEMTGD